MWIAFCRYRVIALLAVSLVFSSSCQQSPLSSDAQAQEQPAPADEFQELSQKVTEVSKRTRDALVFISVSKSVESASPGQLDPFEFFFGVPRDTPPSPRPRQKQHGLGSGFFIDVDENLIVTNNHVVENAEEIEVKLSDGERYPAKIVGRDKYTDLAVLKVDASATDLANSHALQFGSSKSAKVGDFVLAMGAPFGLESSVSFGIVSAIGRGSLGITELGDFIQTDAAINPGNSGGPLLDLQGKVIGVNTAIYSTSGAYNGIGFAVPANIAEKITAKLIKDGKIERGYLGVSLQPLDKNLRESLEVPGGMEGTLVSQVEEGSPAEKAGLKAGDIIFQIQGKNIENPGDVANEIGFNQPGATVELQFLRDGKRKSTEVKLGTFPDTEPSEAKTSSTSLGLSLRPLTEELRQKFDITSQSGVIVSAVEPGSQAAEKGIEPGDVITTVNRNPIESPSEVLRAAEEKQVLLLRLERQGRQFFVALSTKE